MSKANSIHDNRITHRMKPGGPFGFEALCGATKPPDYPLLTTTTEACVNCDECKRIAQGGQQNEEQAPPERIWIDAETNVGRTRGEGTFYFAKPDFPSAAYVPEPPATAGAVSIPDAISVVETMREQLKRDIDGTIQQSSFARDLSSKIEILTTLLVRLRSSSPSVGESAWLIEKGPHEGRVWYITADQVLEWTDDPNKALRLSRREDAEMLCTIVEDAERIAGHEWVSERRASPSVRVGTEECVWTPDKSDTRWYMTGCGKFEPRAPATFCPYCGKLTRRAATHTKEG